MKKYTTYELNENEIKAAVQMYLATKDILYVSENEVQVAITADGDIVALIESEE